MARSEEEILSGLLHFTIGGQTRLVPVRRIASAREWKRELGKALVGQIGAMRFDSLDDTASIANAIGDRMLELVVLYDETNALGGREYLEANATDSEVYAAFREILEVSYPFVRDLPAVTVVLRELARSAPDLSPSPSSTSPASASGVSDHLVVSSAS